MKPPFCPSSLFYWSSTLASLSDLLVLLVWDIRNQIMMANKQSRERRVQARSSSNLSDSILLDILLMRNHLPITNESSDAALNPLLNPMESEEEENGEEEGEEEE